MPHNRETLRIQRRLERAELEHLRGVVAAQGERIEQLEHELACAEDQAIFWSRQHENLREHLDNDTSDARVIGLTKTGELLVVDAGCAA